MAPLHGSVGTGRGRPAHVPSTAWAPFSSSWKQTWCPRAHPVQGGGIRSPGQVCHPRRLPPKSTPRLQDAWVHVGQKSSSCPPHLGSLAVGGAPRGGQGLRREATAPSGLWPCGDGQVTGGEVWGQAPREAGSPSTVGAFSSVLRARRLRVLSWETGGQGH